jgi:hypothetical protein
MYMGCRGEFTVKWLAHYVYTFLKDGFPFCQKGFVVACKVGYHWACVYAGKPFWTRLLSVKGLMMPTFLAVEPTYICELCQVLCTMVDRELGKPYGRGSVFVDDGKNTHDQLLQWLKSCYAGKILWQATVLAESWYMLWDTGA